MGYQKKLTKAQEYIKKGDLTQSSEEAMECYEQALRCSDITPEEKKECLENIKDIKKRIVSRVQSKLSNKIQIEQITGSGKIILLNQYDGVIQGPRRDNDWYYFLVENSEKNLSKGDEVTFDLKKIKGHIYQAVNVKRSN